MPISCKNEAPRCSVQKIIEISYKKPNEIKDGAPCTLMYKLFTFEDCIAVTHEYKCSVTHFHFVARKYQRHFFLQMRHSFLTRNPIKCTISKTLPSINIHFFIHFANRRSTLNLQPVILYATALHSALLTPSLSLVNSADIILHAFVLTFFYSPEENEQSHINILVYKRSFDIIN